MTILSNTAGVSIVISSEAHEASTSTTHPVTGSEAEKENLELNKRQSVTESHLWRAMQSMTHPSQPTLRGSRPLNADFE